VRRAACVVSIIAILLICMPSAWCKKAKDDIFFMVMGDCKLVVSVADNIALKKEAVSVMKGETFVAACKRRKSKIKCSYIDDDNKAYSRTDLKVTYESAPNIFFQDKEGMEHYIVNTANNVVSSVNVNYLMPMVDKHGGILTKVCGGMYLTAEDYEVLRKNR
jgi:hypothetical protein